MKKLLLSWILVIMVGGLVSCEKTLSVEYRIFNYSNQNVTICYTEQLKVNDDQKDGSNNRLYAEDDSIAIIPTNGSKSWKYELGEFPRSQKLTEEYNIDLMGITPLWKRVKYIVIGQDTLDTESYDKQEKWSFENDGNNAIYKLFIR